MKNNINLNKCDLSETYICHSNKNSKCIYPKNNIDCTKCKENSSLVNNICQCNSGYNGIGYIKCYKGDYKECQYINSILGMNEHHDCCLDDRITCWNNHITEINIKGNNLNTNIPESIGFLSGLELLNLSNNKINGNIPESITNLSALKNLDLSNNNLNGSLPKSIGNLSSLKYM
ncbi:hypothetical protein PIROE2DRAFT_12092 [Piromyces sp. E2]|nr:hypothetical protein PIROE2DRAFT_12092 [Piromyces sp. E2]|eukprot:OUM61789.1 hypothetical protein PIROE2DRAFT_12092 [Piromyces sp. E2]